TELQFKVADRCVQLHGGYGYMEEYPISRIWRDARVQRIYGGASEIMKGIVGRSLGVWAVEVVGERHEARAARVPRNRPERLYALTCEALDGEQAALAATAAADAVGVLLITGAGRGFCAGLDI